MEHVQVWTRAAASAAALMIDTSAQGAGGKGVSPTASPTAAPTSSDSVVRFVCYLRGLCQAVSFSGEVQAISSEEPFATQTNSFFSAHRVAGLAARETTATLGPCLPPSASDRLSRYHAADQIVFDGSSCCRNEAHLLRRQQCHPRFIRARLNATSTLARGSQPDHMDDYTKP